MQCRRSEDGNSDLDFRACCGWRLLDCLRLHTFRYYAEGLGLTGGASAREQSLKKFRTQFVKQVLKAEGIVPKPRTARAQAMLELPGPYELSKAGKQSKPQATDNARSHSVVFWGFRHLTTFKLQTLKDKVSTRPC